MRNIAAVLCVLLSNPVLYGQAKPDSVINGSYNCSFLTNTLVNIAGAANCGLFPSSYQVAWTFKLQLWDSSGSAAGAPITPTTSGTGWCGGPYVSCWNINTGVDTPYQSVSLPFTSANAWVFTDTVTSTPPGGLAGKLGYGCAPTAVTVQPSPAVVVNAIICRSIPGSPIIIDTGKEGFHLTALAKGVPFRETEAGPMMRMSWTDPAYHNGWLVLPRHGQVTSLEDMFGNFTPQPQSANPNGYLALAAYDLNHDGVVDDDDPVYARLRIWIDTNHDGISQPSELHTLPEMGVTSLAVTYSESKWVDAYGNQFRYKSSIGDSVANADKRDYDVFLVTGPL